MRCHVKYVDSMNHSVLKCIIKICCWYMKGYANGKNFEPWRDIGTKCSYRNISPVIPTYFTLECDQASWIVSPVHQVAKDLIPFKF